MPDKKPEHPKENEPKPKPAPAPAPESVEDDPPAPEGNPG